MKNTLITLTTFAVISMGGMTFSSGVFAQEESGEVEEATRPMAFSSTSLSGSLYSTYEFRNYDGRDDHDLYEYLSLSFKDIVEDTVDGHFSMSWHEDLDGRTSLYGIESYDPFADLYLSKSDRFRYYTGYIDVKNTFFDNSRLRLGRQYLEEIEHFHFDGASYQFSPVSPVEIDLFGGKPIAYYSSTSGEEIYGSRVMTRITRNTKAGVRYYRYDADQFQDDLLGAELWHMFAPQAQVRADFSMLEGDPYLLQGDFYGRIDEWDFDTVMRVIHLFEEIGDHTINFNPYFPLLYSYQPFTYGSMNMTKGLGQYLSLIGGFSVKEYENIRNDVAKDTNENYYRLFAGFEVYPTEQLTLSVNGEYWDVGADNRFTGVTGEIEYDINKQWEVALGVDYGEYVHVYRDEYQFQFGRDERFRESPYAITYYSKVRWRPTSKLYTGMSFEVEDNEMDEDHWYTLRLEIGSHF